MKRYLTIWFSIFCLATIISSCVSIPQERAKSQSFSVIVSQLNRLNSITSETPATEQTIAKIQADLRNKTRPAWQCHRDMFIAYKQMGELESAAKHIDEAVKLAPKDARLYGTRADFQFSRQNYQASVKDYTQALKLDSSAWSKHWLMLRAQAYRQMDQLQEALDDYSELLKQNPKAKFVYQIRADLYLNKKEYEKAIADCRRIFSMTPNAKGALLTITNAYLAQNKDKEVLQIVKSRSINDFAKYYCLALIQMKLEKYDEAVASAAKAIEMMAPENVVASRFDSSLLTYSLKEILNLKADALSKLGKESEAAVEKAKANQIPDYRKTQITAAK